MRCLTQQVYVDDIEADEEGIAEMLMNEDAVAQVARPGTSLKTAANMKTPGTSQAIRPVTQSGRPITGMLRPGTQGRPDNMEHALRAPRTAKTARPMTSSSGAFCPSWNGVHVVFGTRWTIHKFGEIEYFQVRCSEHGE
ncbi:Tetratricopeptide repeat protein 8 [Halotydeus destructor]|nr:Tetratricopeptide repeat protein 8 [Halotydeus destructor]